MIINDYLECDNINLQKNIFNNNQGHRKIIKNLYNFFKFSSHKYTLAILPPCIKNKYVN